MLKRRRKGEEGDQRGRGEERERGRKGRERHSERERKEREEGGGRRGERGKGEGGESMYQAKRPTAARRHAGTTDITRNETSGNSTEAGTGRGGGGERRRRRGLPGGVQHTHTHTYQRDAYTPNRTGNTLLGMKRGTSEVQKRILADSH